jgi:hypothetical protein
MNDAPDEATCYEEAAHAVVRHSLGYTVLRVCASKDDGFCDSERQWVNMRQAASVQRGIDSMIASCAGFAAVKRAGYMPGYSWRESKDFQNALKLAIELSKGNREAAELLVRWSMQMAETLTEKLSSDINAVAYALLEREKLTREQAAKILNGE